MPDPALACFADRLRATQPVRIVFFGSSVTAGIRCKHKRERSVNFPQQLQQLLESHIPRANITVDVYGYPGASPNFMLACAGSLMRTDHADLYVLEMTDNLSDGYGGVGEAVESLMSVVRQRAPGAAFILLAPIPQRCVRALKRMKPFQHVPNDEKSTLQILHEDCYGNRSVAASFEHVGAAHNVTTVSARNLVRDELFGSPAKSSVTINRLHYDAVHPNGAGHWEIAVALEHAILRLLHVAAPSPILAPAPPAGAKCATSPPGALESANMFAPRRPSPRSTVCAVGEDLRQHILRASGWRYIVERNAQGLPKPGYVASDPGATMDLCYKPELKPSRVAAAGDTYQVYVAWSLGYLMSYEHMGRMRGECLRKREGSSCSCGARVFDAHWRLPVSQPHISRLKLAIRYARSGRGSPLVPEAALANPARAAAATACPCVIRFTLLNTTSSDSHKFKLVSLMSGFYTGTIVSDAVGWAARYDIM